MTDWHTIVVPAVRELPLFPVAETIAEVDGLATHVDGAKLNWNENLFGPLPGVLDAVTAGLANVWLYPVAPYDAFRAEVAEHVGIEPGCIFPGHGTQALIGTVASALLQPGDAVVQPERTFYLYAGVSAARGADVHRVPMRGDLSLDLPGLAARARAAEARLVWVCDPNNPTGLTLDRDEWEVFLDDLPDRCVVVADEAYVDYLSPERRLERERDVAAGRPVVVLRTFSKFYGLAGLRLGYAIADAALVDRLGVVEEPFNVNCAALAAGRASLRAAEAAVRRRKEIAGARALLCEGLRDSGAEPYPSQANFVLARVGVDDVKLAGELARDGILVRACSELGLPGHVRIAVGPTPVMERATAAFARASAAVGS
ncbi:MAG: pyridoxal phosphate-dependent aminotransferase [Gaiellaceae bacterium]